MNIEFFSSAEIELADAIAYYNSQKENLGLDFANEINKTIALIIDFPNAWTKLSKRTRRCCTTKFPYGVIYRISNEILYIVAIMNLRQIQLTGTINFNIKIPVLCSPPLMVECNRQIMSIENC